MKPTTRTCGEASRTSPASPSARGARDIVPAASSTPHGAKGMTARSSSHLLAFAATLCVAACIVAASPAPASAGTFELDACYPYTTTSGVFQHAAVFGIDAFLNCTGAALPGADLPGECYQRDGAVDWPQQGLRRYARLLVYAGAERPEDRRGDYPDIRDE